MILLAATAPAIAAVKLSDSSALRPWTGVYVGGSVGYGWGQANETIQFHESWLTDGTGDDTFLAPFGNKQLKPTGFVGGAQFGYNYQINHWVPGIVVGVDDLGEDAKYSSDSVMNAASGNTYIVTSSYTIDWLVRISPKIGYTMGAFLPYITGGLGIAHQKFSQDVTQQNLNFNENGSVAKTVYGWTIGAGAEYALAKHWRIMIEYLFIELPSSSVGSTGMFNGGPINYSATHSVQLNTNIIHAGLIYRF